MGRPSIKSRLAAGVALPGAQDQGEGRAGAHAENAAGVALPPPGPLGEDTIFTPSQAAEILQASPRTLADWRQAGRGPRWGKHGRAYVFYRLGDLRAFIRSGLGPAGAGAGR